MHNNTEEKMRVVVIFNNNANWDGERTGSQTRVEKDTRMIKGWAAKGLVLIRRKSGGRLVEKQE